MKVTDFVTLYRDKRISHFELKKNNIMKGKAIIFASLILITASCGFERSSTTGWNLNDPKNGGYEKAPFENQETGPNLVLIEGGAFTMGRVIDDVMYDWHSIPRKVTVSSYYMDETEISNFQWGEYIYWLDRVFGADYPEVYVKALPDTLVWRDKLAYNEPYVEYYFRHPAYRDYPVVGVNWLQCNDFCAWRTDRVNEFILIREGILEHYINQVNEDNFNTDAYLLGQYESGKRIEGIPDYHPNRDFRNVRMEDGVLLPRFRLPTEAEWEYAAYGLIGNAIGERIVERRQWPWNGHAVRNPEEKNIGMMMANFKRGRGDNMGIAGRLNDNADVTAPVYSYWPNDYGLYNMAGNVSEWVMDVYRPLSLEDMTDFRAFRGNVFQTWEKDEDGLIAEKDSLGKIRKRTVTEEENVDRRNYRRSDNINYLDGNFETTPANEYWIENPAENPEKNYKLHNKHSYAEKKGESDFMYDYSVTSMINDRARVYKGASWKDKAYYMNPGTRRFLDEKQRTSYIGFRCAMDRVGSPKGF
jgi:formylglycine-generating enzyme